MYIKLRSIIFFVFLSTLCVSCNESISEVDRDPKIIVQFSKINLDIDSTHFRGLNMLTSDHVWSSGTDGSYAFYSDEHWEKGKIDSASGLDLRDVHVLSECEIVVVSAGRPGKIFKTRNCGETWSEVYTNYDSLIFLDGMDFNEDGRGVAFGDPMNGKLKLLKSLDFGTSWVNFDSSKIPKTLPVEAGFAASGTGIILFDSLVYIGLGGEKARFMRSENFGNTWQIIETPILQGDAGKGIYTMAFKDKMNGVAAGGNWEDPECDSSKIYTNDGGLTWNLSEGLQHYRSCVTHVVDDIYISTGTLGTDVSYDNGKSWQFLDSIALNAIQFDSENQIGYGVGSYGKIFKIEYSFK